MIKRAGALAALSALAFVLAAACGGGGGTTTTVQTVPPGSKVTPNAVTGTGELDQLIVAAVSGNDIELAALTGYQKLPCKQAPAPGELAPACREGEDEGTQVEALPVSGCTQSLVRPEQVPDAFRTAFPGSNTNVLSAYRPKADAGSYGGGFGAGQVIVFSTGAHPNTAPMGAALHVRDGRIVWLESDCDNVFTLVTPERVESFILDLSGTPGNAQPLPSPTPGPITNGAPPDGGTRPDDSAPPPQSPIETPADGAPPADAPADIAP